MKKLAVLAVAGLISVTASATNWVLVSSSAQSIAYIDADSISNSSGYKTAFVKLDLTQYDYIISKGYNSLISLQQFNCRSKPRKYRVLSARGISGNRTVEMVNASSNWTEDYPDSMGRNITNFVCSR